MVKAGEFVDFTDGVKAAELTGYWVDICREKLEELARIPSLEDERTLYKTVAAFRLRYEAGSHAANIVFVSQTGALALKGDKETDWRAPFQLAKDLDGGNYILPLALGIIDNSELVFSQAPSPFEIDRMIEGFNIPDTVADIE